MPKLSIVTAVFNGARFLKHAIYSALDADVDRREIEHIVVDGGSTDGTIDVLLDFPHLRVVSEPDDGVYDAMNKGIRMARGEFVGLLNSDDRYRSGTLSRSLREMRDDVDMVGGGATVVDATVSERPVLRTYETSYPPLKLLDLTRGVPRINAWFIRRQLFASIGLFDTSLTMAADREWLLRAWMTGPATKALGLPIYEYGVHEGSLTFQQDGGRLFRREHLEICRRFLDDEDTPVELRRELRTWQSQLRAGGLRDAYRSHGLFGSIRSPIRPSWRDIPWLARASVHRWRGPV